MESRFSESKRLMAVVAVAAVVLSVKAQDAGQPIIFSTPQKNGDSSSAPSLSAKTPNQPDFQNDFGAPQAFLKPGFSSQPMPQPQAVPVSRAERQLQEDRKNWALMTPAEILGVATVEASDLGKSQVERYLERQNQFGGGVKNDSRSDNAKSPWNFSFDRQDANASGIGDNDSESRARQSLNNYLDDNQKNSASANGSDNSDWNLFGSSQSRQPTKFDFAQQQKATMERFQQLLNPNSVSDVSQSPNGSFFSAPKTPVNPNLAQPALSPNPVGASFLPITSDFGRPAGLPSLPQVVTPMSLQPAAPPSWTLHAAPWLSQQPQPFAVPQRNF